MCIPPRHRVLALLLLAFTFAAPASAEWTQDEAILTGNVFSLVAKGDTVLAGADTVVYVSTNGGDTWTHSKKPVNGVTSVEAVLMHNGRLYAGTVGQGVFVSDDRGASWQAYNQGLVGGILDTQLQISDLAVRGDSLYAATYGAGVYVRKLSGVTTWSHFGEEFEPNQASSVQALTLGGNRLLASAGGNGMVFFRDPGTPEWTDSFLDNVGLRPGTTAVAAAWNGQGWVVATNKGTFRSTLGQEPWTFTNPGLGALLHGALTTIHHEYFAAFDVINGVVIEHSGDEGASWDFLEFLPGAFVYKIAASRGTLFAARSDGLWRRSSDGLGAPPVASPAGLGFAVAGAQPIRDEARLRFTLARAGRVRLELYDVAGRHAAVRLEGAWPAGPQELALDARGLEPGVYQALLHTEQGEAATRIVRVR